MNKFKSWLITKLGGNPYPINTDQLVEKQYIGSPIVLYNEMTVTSDDCGGFLTTFTTEGRERFIVEKLLRDFPYEIMSRHLYSYKEETCPSDGTTRYSVKISIYNEKK